MKCKKYRSKEAYYGVDGPGGVPTLTGPFWECEPEDEELQEALIEWARDTGEILEPGQTINIVLYCDECDEDIEFEVDPADVFSKDELKEINIDLAKEAYKNGEIDEDDYKYIIDEIRNIFNGKK